MRKWGWPAEAVEFFTLFARVERALKESGMLKNKRRAEADWVQFAAARRAQ
jgi:hypothetical protein